MSTRRLLNDIVYGILKIGVIIFLFPIAWDINSGIGPNGSIFLRILTFSVFGLISFFILSMDVNNFNLFGFMIVLIVSLYKLFDIIFTEGLLDTRLATYFFAICISIYFMTKEQRSKKKRGLIY